MKNYLDPKNDLVFKKIFGEHPNLLISFLNALLKFDDGSKIIDIEYIPTELIPENPLKKRSVVDVRCKDSYGRHFIVEMQMEWTTAFMERLLFNASKVYGNQIKKGEEYTSLQPVYGLSILNQNFDRKTNEYYHQFEMLNRENLDERINGIKLVLIELHKFEPVSLVEKGMAVLWLRFLQEMKDGKLQIPDEFTENEEIAEAVEICEKSAYTDEELLEYDRQWDAVSYERTLMSGKLAEGLAEGMAKGMAKGIEIGEKIGEKAGIEKGERIGIEKGERIGIEKGERIGEKRKALETAKKMRARGLPVSDIADFTGLSEDEINNLSPS